MRQIRAPGSVSEDDAMDAERPHCGEAHLQAGGFRARTRRKASQLRERSYGRDLGAELKDDCIVKRTLERSDIPRQFADCPRGTGLSLPDKPSPTRLPFRAKNIRSWKSARPLASPADGI